MRQTPATASAAGWAEWTPLEPRTASIEILLGVPLGLDAWAEAGRRPVLQEASSRLYLPWAALLERTIRAGVAVGVFRCDDPVGAAWRILSLVDGLALQVVAHRNVVERADMLAWAATAVQRELGLAPGVLAVSNVPEAVATPIA